MTSDNNQGYNHKNSQGDWDTSLLLQEDTRSHISEQQHFIFFKWKLECGNGIPKGNPPRTWFRIPQNHQDH